MKKLVVFLFFVNVLFAYSQNKSSVDINKTYNCLCCKGEIKGIYEGVDESGNEASPFSLDYYLSWYK